MKTLHNSKQCNDFFDVKIFNDDNNIKIPIDYANLIEKNNINDPLLRQIFLDNKTNNKEFTKEPLLDSKNSKIPNIIHKYNNRVLLIVTKSCEIFCRYCFRQNFPYSTNDITKNWPEVENYLTKKKTVNEVILSGGDPLSLSNDKLELIINNLSKIKNIKTIRIHSRTFSINKDRINNDFIKLINNCQKKIVIVSHINHPNEITKAFNDNIKKLNCSLLNQSVLLKGVNDDAKTLIALSEKLWDIGIMPYYLHLLDKVSDCEDYFVSDVKAKKIYQIMQSNLSGYQLPKLVRDENKPYKTILS